MKTISIDIESYSSVDLTKSGVYKYAEADDFEILLFGYCIDHGEVQVVDLTNGENIPPDVLTALTDDAVEKWAFNANFERVCLSRYLSDRDISLDPSSPFLSAGTTPARFLNPSSWRCSMVWSAYMGLPLSLEKVGSVLGLEKQKLSEGKDLIRYFCKPCAATIANGKRTRNLPEHASDKWELIKSYNHRDVETEMAIQARLAKFPVPDSIWEEYRQDQEINDRGVLLDMALVRMAIAANEQSKGELLIKMQALTALENPNSVSQMKDWLAENGLETDTLAKRRLLNCSKLHRNRWARSLCSVSNWQKAP